MGDTVLFEVSKNAIVAGVCLNVEKLCMTKSLTKRVYFKGKLFWCKMSDDKNIEDNLDDFSKTVLYLENIGVKVDDGDQANKILNPLPSLRRLSKP